MSLSTRPAASRNVGASNAGSPLSALSFGGLSFLGVMALAAGCSPGPIGAPFGSELVGPTEQVIPWVVDSFYDGVGDGYGALLYGEFSVQSDEGYPMNGIKVEVLSGFPTAYLIVPGAIQAQTNVYDDCMEGGKYTEEECDLWFGDENQSYAQLSGSYVDIDDFRPTYMQGVTNSRGVLPVWIFIDQGLSDGGSFTVFATIGVDSIEYDVVFYDPTADDEETTEDTGDTGDTTPEDTGAGTGE